MVRLKGFSFILIVTGIVLLTLLGGSYYFIRSYGLQIRPRPLDDSFSFTGGITGKAILGPTCPVEKAGETCSQPYQGSVVVKSDNGSREVTRFTTDKNGQFKISLPPGNYILTGDPQTRFPFLKEVRVEVKPNGFTEVQLNFDTGIR